MSSGYIFAASNNVTEYEALVNGLKIAIDLWVRRLDVRGDCQLVTDQVMKASSEDDPKMEAYCKEVCKLEDKFHSLELVHIARQYNEAADELANIASTRGTVPPDAFSSDQLEPSVDLSAAASIEAASEPIDTVEALLAAVEVMEIEQPSRHPSRPFDCHTPFPRLPNPRRGTRRLS